ncbi:MAG: SDR family NAD(P)-dependent oxidoreductase [Pseudomonadota bacterium]|nr:SDR family NAD(P)-dependent oxidoreductase [Pseudomonadota bacterium]
MRKHACVIGASAGLGRALCHKLAAENYDLLLVASDARDLDAMARDLRIRHSGTVSVIVHDLSGDDPELLVKNILLQMSEPDLLACVAGYTSPHDHGPLAADEAARVLNVNAVQILRVINGCMPALERPEARLLVISSVACMRPRRRNILYGAAKAALEHYAMALQHYWYRQPGKVYLYRMGFMHTQMTYGQKLMLPGLSPEKAAQAIMKDIGYGRSGMHYLPGWWRIIALVFRVLPWAVFRRLDI